jgi:ribosomal protein S18 acetylase RimI-like enzyme
MSRTRDATQADLAQVIEIHRLAFPGFFLTRMGVPFLQLLYRGFMSRPNGVLLVAFDDEAPAEVLGFVAGTMRPERFFIDLLRSHWLDFAWASLWPLLRQPGLVALKLWSALFYRGETLPELPDAALLSSLGVRPTMHQQGLGRLLVHSFVQRAQCNAAPAVYLTTDQDDNAGTNAFYLRCGFRLEGTCKRPPRRILNRYLLMFEP